MGQFFKFLFASCLGVLLALFVLFVVVGVGVGSIINRSEKNVNIKPNSVLMLTFDQNIPEKTNNVKSGSLYDLETEQQVGLHDMIASINAAKIDPNIKGIYINADNFSAGYASMQAMRRTLEDFKQSGKFILAYAKYYDQRTYYLASLADKIYINPLGRFDFRGIAAQVPFVKDFLDKIGVKMQVYYAGQFKSATEPFRLSQMSDANRLQTREYITDIYNTYLEGISQSRQISVPQLKNIADKFSSFEAKDAVNQKLIDATAYEDEVLDEIRSRTGLDKKDKINKIKLSDYFKNIKNNKDIKIKDKIAVVYAEGDIVDGKGDAGAIGDEKYVDILRKIRHDDAIKAIVLRINSPGGSAISSENIWRELTLSREAGKKVVVSMGDYAASGGYYIACASDSIFAEPNTLTGSIGVFMAIPNAQTLMKDKIGITFDTLKTGRNAAFGNIYFPFTTEQGDILQKSVDATYETFLKRVADNRKMSHDAVHAVAQGRVWAGNKAKEIGLVDKIGGLEDAIAAAAHLTGLEKYRTTEYPHTKEPIQQLIDKITKNDEEAKIQFIKSQLGEQYPYYEYILRLKRMSGLQMRLPYEMQIN